MADDVNKITVTVDRDLEELIPEFLELTRNDIASMSDALGKGDFDTVRTLGHTMKGSGGGYGFDFLTEIGAKIEQFAKTKTGEQIGPLIEKLQRYLEQVNIVYE